jgi:hypothetical protein
LLRYIFINENVTQQLLNFKIIIMNKITTLFLCIFMLIASSMYAVGSNLYLIANNSSTWTSTPTGFANVYKVDLSNSGTNGTTAVSLTQWLNDRNAAAPTFLIGGAAGTTFAATDQIWIAGGTYNVGIAWSILSGATTPIPAYLYGGFAGNEASISERSKGANKWNYTNETIINGSSSTTGIINENGDRTITLEGLTFTGCGATYAVYQRGGTNILNCKFTSNTVMAVNYYTTTGSKNALMTGCYFYNNSTTATAACLSVNNTSSGGVYTLSGCTFESNSCSGTGTGSTAGIKLAGVGTNSVDNCIFKNNSASAGNTTSCAISMSTVTSTVCNSLVYGSSGKPALYISSGNIIGCTFANNAGNAAYLNNTTADNIKIKNTAFWATPSSSAYIYISGASATAATLTNCAYINISTPQTNNTNPVTLFTSSSPFVDQANANFELIPGSLLIDAGATLLAPYNVDIIGTSRPQNSLFDIGAYEFVKSTPVITWTQDLTVLRTTDSPVTLAATSSAGANGAAITYTSSDNNIVSVSGSTLTVVGAGSATVTAHQASNGFFNAATDVSQTVTVSKATPAISWTQNLTGLKTTDTPVTLAATSSAGANGAAITYTSSDNNIVSVSGSTLTVVGAGSATVTAHQVSNAYFEAATDVSQSVIVSKITPSITWIQDLTGLKTTGTSVTLTATSSATINAAIITYTSSDNSVVSVSGSILTMVGAGSATVTAHQASNAYFDAATDVSQSVIVSKITPSITWTQDLTGLKTTGTSVTLTATSSATTNAAIITYTSSDNNVVSVSGSTLAIVGAGSATVTAHQASNAYFEAVTDVLQSVIVSKITPAITWTQDLTGLKTTGTPVTLTATSSATTNAATITYTSSDNNVVSVSGSILTMVDAGSATVTAHQASNAFFDAATDVSQSVTVISPLTGVDDVTAQDIRIFKNTNGQITVSRGNVLGEGKVSVCNTMGQLLLNCSTTGGTTVLGKVFPSGVYLIIVDLNGTKATKKIIIN